MLSTIDLVIVAVYAVGLFALAQWVSREPATMRFITAYSKKDDELTDKSVTPVPGILERLVSVVERSVRGE